MTSSSLGPRATCSSLLFSLALLASASAACKKKSGVEAAAPVGTVAADSVATSDADNDKCDAIVAKLTETMKKSAPQGTLTPEAQAKLDGVFTKAHGKMLARCTADEWPTDFATCVEKATDPESLDGCKLPADLERRMMEDLQPLVPEIIEALQGAQPPSPATDGAATPKGN